MPPPETAARQLSLLPHTDSLADTRPARNQILDADRPVHDWYRFVLSFPPHLVREYAAQFGLGDGDTVLDPFCGTGTTLVEAKKLGLASVGIEAVPFSAFVSGAKIDWTPDPEALRTSMERVSKHASSALAQSGSSDAVGGPIPATLETLPSEQHALLLRDSISPLPLHKALILRNAIDAVGGEHRSHLLLALARELPSTIGNLRFGPEIGLGKRKDDVAVIAAWRAQVETMCADLHRVGNKQHVSSVVHRGDARNAGGLLPACSIDAVITSPPYPNEKDYTRTVRLESVILGMFGSRPELRGIKRTLVRSNTRGVYRDDDDDRWLREYPQIAALADEIEARRLELGKTSGFERTYHRVTRLYFGGMARHLTSLQSVLKPGAQLAYVVGDQASYFRVMIRTGTLLAEIAERLGYEVEGIDLFRTRAATATREQINEEVVRLRWRGSCRG